MDSTAPCCLSGYCVFECPRPAPSHGACLLTGGGDGRVKLWNLSNGKFVREFVKDSTSKGGRANEISELLYRPNGTNL